MINKKLLLTAIAASTASIHSTQAIELTDYDDPVSSFESAYVTGQMNAKSGNQDQTSYDLNIIGDYDSSYSSREQVLDFTFDGTLSSSRSAEEGADSETGYDTLLNLNLSRYLPDHEKVFWFASGTAGYRQLLGNDDADDPYTKVGVGMGYGRVVNATPLALAIRVVEELQEYGLIKQQLSDGSFIELAQLISKENEYRQRYGSREYHEHWFAAIEQLLQRHSLLTEGKLTAAGAIRINRVLKEEKVSIRKHGWLVKGGVGYVLSNYDGSDSNPSIDLGFEYAHPFSVRTQFIETASYSTILGDDTAHVFDNNMSLSYEVSDRLDWVNGWNYNLLTSDRDGTEDVTTNTAFTSLNYYLANNLDAGLTLRLTDIEDNVANNGNDDTDASLFFGITYRVK